MRIAILPLAFAAGTALAAPGALDPSFGQGGRMLTDFSHTADLAHAVAVQPDGKLVVVGTTYANNDFSGEDFALARYRPDGTLDPGFGVKGRVTTDIPGLAAELSAVLVQPDGKILVAGGAFPLLAFLGDFRLARYLPDGRLDASFGQGGIVTTSFPGQGSYAFALALQPDGRILAAGTEYVDFSSDASSNTDFALARYDADGSLDTSFGQGGLVTTDFARLNDDAFAVMVQPDGRIVAVGSARTNTTDYDFAIARYLPDGTPDDSFGQHGRMRTDFGQRGFDRAMSAVLQPDGMVVAAGFATSLNGGTQDFALARYATDGTLDRGFGNLGKMRVSFGSCCQAAHALLLQSDGKLVAVGYPDSESSDSDFTLARLNTDGSLDATFGDGGRVRTSFGSLNGGAQGAALQADGRIVAVGFQATATPQSVQFALARYLAR